MIFKDIKVGYPLYVLDRDTMRFTQPKVTNTTLPHADAKMGGTLNMVVDITTSENKTYVVVSDSETAYPNNSVIATDISHIKREVEAVKSTAENALAQVEHERELVTKCNQLLSEIDPVQKERQQTEARFNKLESNMDSIMQMLKKLTD